MKEIGQNSEFSDDERGVSDSDERYEWRQDTDVSDNEGVSDGEGFDLDERYEWRQDTDVSDNGGFSDGEGFSDSDERYGWRQDDVSDFEPRPSGSEQNSLPPQSYFKKLKSILLNHRLYFIGICLVFFASVVLGYILSYYNPEFILPIFENFADFENETSFELAIKLFLNNSLVVILLVLLGFLLIVPLLIIFINGLVIGIVFEYFAKEASPMFFLVGIIPHGIIELPMFILAGAVGFRIGVRILLCLFGTVSFPDLKKDIFNALWILCLFIIPMLFAAAFIEAYITGYLLEVFF